MPFLDWVNKAQAQRAAADVPYHLLQFQSAHGEAASENMLIQGDNLLALKALLPFYRGKVKCIFIDPPYNTQSAFEHYDDKLEHSRWLSMITPPLVLLRELLAYRFKKHYYPVIHDLREKRKDGKPAEEFVCARHRTASESEALGEERRVRGTLFVLAADIDRLLLSGLHCRAG